VGRHHCWAAGPLGLGLSLYILYPIYYQYIIHYTSTWYQRARLGLGFHPSRHLPPLTPTAACPTSSRLPHVQPPHREAHPSLPGRLPCSHCLLPPPTGVRGLGFLPLHPQPSPALGPAAAPRRLILPSRGRPPSSQPPPPLCQRARATSAGHHHLVLLPPHLTSPHLRPPQARAQHGSAAMATAGARRPRRLGCCGLGPDVAPASHGAGAGAATPAATQPRRRTGS
jgi:hypothetical protein